MKVLPPGSEATANQEMGSNDNDASDEEFLEASEQAGGEEEGMEGGRKEGERLYRLPPAVGSGLT